MTEFSPGQRKGTETDCQGSEIRRVRDGAVSRMAGLEKIRERGSEEVFPFN